MSKKPKIKQYEIDIGVQKNHSKQFGYNIRCHNKQEVLYQIIALLQTPLKRSSLRSPPLVRGRGRGSVGSSFSLHSRARVRRRLVSSSSSSFSSCNPLILVLLCKTSSFLSIPSFDRASRHMAENRKCVSL